MVRGNQGVIGKIIAGLPAIAILSRAGFNSELIVANLFQSLFTAKIFFSGLHREVAQQKLNLFQLAQAPWQRRAHDLRRSNPACRD
jgi:hypothetical protein